MNKSYPNPNPTLPQLSRPARPERCQACDFEIGITRSDSIPVADCEKEPRQYLCSIVDSS